MCACRTDFFLLRTGSHKTQNKKVFYEFKIIDFSCMLAHLENANIATVAQSKQHIVANCNVFGVLVPKYATIPLVLMGYCPLEHWKQIGSKKEKAVFWMVNHQKVYFSASDCSKPSKSGSTHDFTFRKQYGYKTKSSKKSRDSQFLYLRVQ